MKEAIDRLKQIGIQLRQLEERKIIAIREEDYDGARIIKSEIDRLRNAVAPDILLTRNPNQNYQPGDLPPVHQKSYGGAAPLEPWRNNQNNNVPSNSNNQIVGGGGGNNNYRNEPVPQPSNNNINNNRNHMNN